MRITKRQSVLVSLVSLFNVDYRSTAFIPNSRRQGLPRSPNVQDGIDCSGDTKASPSSTTTRLFASPTTSSDNKSTPNNRNGKRTTELRAATGIALPSSPSVVVSPKPVEVDRSGVGVLFLNLGGPTTGDDVEGTFRERYDII